MAEARDLDVLRPASRHVILGGQKIDVSFVPSAITFDLQVVLSEMAALDQKKMAKSDLDELETAFLLGVRVCTIFCAHNYPEMTEEWFLAETNAEQISALSTEIQGAYVKAFEGIDPNPKAGSQTTAG